MFEFTTAAVAVVVIDVQVAATLTGTYAMSATLTGTRTVEATLEDQ